MIAEGKPVDIEREAWKLVLNGAESHVEDAIEEDGEFNDETYEQITDRAMAIIQTFRNSMDIRW